MRGKIIGYNDSNRSFMLNSHGDTVVFNYPPAHADLIHLLLGSDLIVAVDHKGEIWNIEVPEA